MAKNVSSLVSAAWLKDRLSSNLNNRIKHLKLLDASWKSTTNGDYLNAHIPGAHFFDMNKCEIPTPTIPRNLPHPECFQNYISSLGISGDTHIVVYDRRNMVGPARLWWNLHAFGHRNVSVLNGGLNSWISAGLDCNSGEEIKPQAGNFKVNINKSLITDFDDVITIIKNQSSQIVDARKPEHFSGQLEEPSSYSLNSLKFMNQPLPTRMLAGHICGSRNLFKDLVLDENKMLHTPEKLRKLFSDVGIDLSKPLISLCYGGYSACLLALAAHQCGKEDTAVYYGSWTEFGQIAESNLIETSENISCES